MQRPSPGWLALGAVQALVGLALIVAVFTTDLLEGRRGTAAVVVYAMATLLIIFAFDRRHRK